MSFNCDNCGSALTGAVIECGIRFTACPSCGSLHNVQWLQCRADGKPYLQPPIRLPESTRIGRNEAGLVITVQHQSKQRLSDWLVGGVVVAVFGGVGMACILFGPMPVGIALCAFTSLLLLAGIAETISPNRIGVEIATDAEAVTLYRLQRRGKVKEFSMPWREIRLVDPYCKAYPGIPGAQIYGIKLIKKDGTEQEILSSIATPEHSLFLAYHLQREPDTRVKGGKPVRAGAKPTRARTLADLRVRSQKREAGLVCGHCGAPIDAKHISTEHKAAICTYCGAIEDLKEKGSVFTGDAGIEFQTPYLYVHQERALELTKGDENEAPVTRESSTAGIAFSVGFFFSFWGTGVLFAATKSVWALLFAPFSLLTGAIVAFRLRKQYVTPLTASRIKVTPKGVVFSEKRAFWRNTEVAKGARVQNVKACSFAAGDNSAFVVFMLDQQDSLTSFPMPTPWHARQIAREAKEILGLPD